MSSVTVVDHPLVQHKLSILRDRETSTSKFRQLLREISQFLAYAVTRDLPMTSREIETPLCSMAAPTLDGPKLRKDAETVRQAIRGALAEPDA